MSPRGLRAASLAIISALLATARVDAAPWFVFTEIHYHPASPAEPEFVELCLHDAPRVDISGWRIDGEIEFTFPPGSLVLPHEHVVVSSDPKALLARHESLAKAYGPFAGRLDNAGGRLRLLRPGGAVAAETRYGRDGEWTALADGAGASLSLIDDGFDPLEPASWRASRVRGGTPGRANEPGAEPATPIVARGETWRYLVLETEPPSDWHQPGFDDSAWDEGPSGFGFGDDDDATIVDLRQRVLALCTRRTFVAGSWAPGDHAILRVDFDDGFALWLNGREVARQLLGRPGSPLSRRTTADEKHEAGAPIEIDLGPAASVFREGENTIAARVHNESLDSSDLTLIVELETRPPTRPHREPTRPVWNEIVLRPDAPQDSFVELYHPSSEPFDLSGAWISTDPNDLRRWRVPAGTVLDAFGVAALPVAPLLDGLLANAAPSGLLLLAAPDGHSLWAAIRIADPAAPDAVVDAVAIGRQPDGSATVFPIAGPSRGSPSPASVHALAITEIQYHPISELEGDEYVEILNHGAVPIDLSGFRIEGGIRHVFEPRSLDAGERIVVARDPTGLARRHGLDERTVVGPFAGRLSDRGESLRLLDATGQLVVEARWADGRPWPELADGGGSSLELRHPLLDPTLAASWSASDESTKSEWTRFTYRKPHRAFQGRNHEELQLLLLESGACLIDDLSFARAGQRSAIPDGDFERGEGAWRALGTHAGSAVATGGAPGDRCLRIISSGRGDPRQNHVARDVAGLVPGAEYEVSFRARWLSGAPHLLTRTGGQGVARTHRLPIPDSLGTPGRANSRHDEHASPAVDTPRQWPVAPAPGEVVTFAVRASGIVPIESVLLRFRAESGEEGRVAFQRVRSSAPPLRRAELWEGSVPPLRQGVVAFSIEATDAAGRTGRFPDDAAHLPRARDAFWGVGHPPHRRLPTLTLLASSETWSALFSDERMSNRLHTGTLLYGDRRIIYDVDFRRRGSPFTRNRFNWRVAFGAESLDGRRRLTIDGQGGDGTSLSERLTYWLIDQLGAPSSRSRYVYFKIPGIEEGVFEDVERVSGDYLDRWYGDAADDGRAVAGLRHAPRPRRAVPTPPTEERAGELFKVDDHFEFFFGQRAYVDAYLQHVSDDPEDYRFSFKPRAEGHHDDFAALMELARLFDRSTPLEELESRAEETVDVDTWLRVLAARALVDDWDTFGRRRGKNAFLYRSFADGLWRLLPWDADLSWRNPSADLLESRFPSIDRLLSIPAYRRQYLAYVGFLAGHSLSPAIFGGVLDDLAASADARSSSHEHFAAVRRAYVDRLIPNAAFGISRVERLPRAEGPDEVEIAGSPPALAVDFELDGRRGQRWFEDSERFVARFAVGPEGGDLVLRALDAGGREAGAQRVRVPARPGAAALPQAPQIASGVVVIPERLPALPVRTPRPQLERPVDGLAEVDAPHRGNVRRTGGRSTATRGAPPGRSVAHTRPAPRGWSVVFRVATVLLAVQVAALVGVFVLRLVRRRRAVVADPILVRAISHLADDYAPARAALELLASRGVDAGAVLIAALDDRRLTPFGALVAEDAGLTAAPCEGKPMIRVRHVARELLVRALGGPPPGGESHDSWLRHWRRTARRLGRYRAARRHRPPPSPPTGFVR